MGRYRLGDIVRMTRKSLSITQEQLCEDICSAETLSRIETGRQNPSKDVYELLMERMGRIRDRAYSMLSVSDFKVLEKMRQFETCIHIYDYHRAEYILEDIKRMLGGTNLDKQFIIRADSLVNYRLNRIDTDEFLEELQKAIRITIPRYGEISLSNWPLNHNEVTILLNISSVYSEKEDYKKGIDILEEVNNALKQSYIDREQRAILQVVITSNLSKWYGQIEEHQKAIETAYEGIEICKEFKIGNVLPHLLYNYAWIMEQLIEKGEQSPENKRECISYLKQAYYIACAMQQSYMEQFIKGHLAMYHDIML
ncbi:MAG: helix-turn-helix domain-containing protein [Clostridiales bacterium]|jgi:transcriptional regulator with XRE-family HTH domain|nr:helix-turn-helix domain-containing protein [Clostridiales bacterium]